MSEKLGDGCEYNGGWSKGMPNGQGRVQWPDGWVFEGDFKDGKPHRGNLKSPNLFVEHSNDRRKQNSRLSRDSPYSLGVARIAR